MILLLQTVDEGGNVYILNWSTWTHDVHAEYRSFQTKAVPISGTAGTVEHYTRWARFTVSECRNVRADGRFATTTCHVGAGAYFGHCTDRQN